MIVGMAAPENEQARFPTDTLRLDIREADESVGGHEVLIYVNEVEVTRLGAGMGMNPFHLLIPENQLVATSTPTRVPVARCECGIYGCGATDVVIVRDGDMVHWEWVHEAPMDRQVTFAADPYAAEVARVAADRSWERPEDTVTRLVLQGFDHDALAAWGLGFGWAAKDHADARLFMVALRAGDWSGQSPAEDHQVFLRFALDGCTPEAMAETVIAELRRRPQEWDATWHAVMDGVVEPPAMAGPRWRRERIL